MSYSADAQELNRAVERDKSKQLMEMPDGWPMWPILPLKNRKIRDRINFPLLGYMMDDAAKGYFIYLGNPFAPDPTDTLYKHYDTVDQMIDDGWVVD